jgi:hypothetical protein
MTDVTERERAFYWHAAVIRGGCVMCRAFPVSAELRRARSSDFCRPEAHHIIDKNFLKREGLREHLWDERNGLCLCRYHHGQHTSWMQRVPLRLVPAAACVFAESLGVLWRLELDYPLEAA